jgi:hypothetical protein
MVTSAATGFVMVLIVYDMLAFPKWQFWISSLLYGSIWALPDEGWLSNSLAVSCVSATRFQILPCVTCVTPPQNADILCVFSPATVLPHCHWPITMSILHHIYRRLHSYSNRLPA